MENTLFNRPEVPKPKGNFDIAAYLLQRNLVLAKLFPDDVELKLKIDESKKGDGSSPK